MWKCWGYWVFEPENSRKKNALALYTKWPMLKPQSEIQPHGTPYVIQKPSNLQHPQPFGGVGLLPLKRPISRIHRIHAKSYELDAEIKSAWCQCWPYCWERQEHADHSKQEIMAALEASSLNPCIRSNFAHPPSSDVCPNLASRMQKHTEPGANDGHIAWENSCERTPQTIQAWFPSIAWSHSKFRYLPSTSWMPK